MRHATDGELHAYLDGALDLLPDGRGAEVRAHLSSCSACKERLQDEEFLRSSAEEILRDPGTASLAIPTFEELREQADAVRPLERERERRHSRTLWKGMPLAWAASVVLAVGVGWMGSQLWRGLPQDGQAVPRGPDMTGQDAASSGVELAEPPAPAPADLQAAASAGQVAAMREAAEPGQAPSSFRQPSGRSREAGDVLDLTDLSGGRSYTVPGLKIISVEFEEWTPGERVLRIRQLLSMGDTLELRYLGLLMGSDPEEVSESGMSPEAGEAAKEVLMSPQGLEASLPAGWHQVAMKWGRGWLVARAPLPKESIKALLLSLR